MIPFGLFHPHEPLHHIKKENIEFIEVMGLAILPGGLLAEVDELTAILTGELQLSTQMQTDEKHPLYKHVEWISQLIKEYGQKMGIGEASEKIEQAVGDKFPQVLLDAGVYKRDQAGQAGFQRFMEHVGYVRE